MSTLADMGAVNWKLTMRKKFVDMIQSLNPIADPALEFSSILTSIPSCDFTKLFERLLVDDGVHSDSYDNINWDENDQENDNHCHFVNTLMDYYDTNPSLYMSFLSFIVNRNAVLAKMMFERVDFRIANCLEKLDFALHDFETVLAYDITLGSDIFRNKAHPVIYQVCSFAIIPPYTIQKMKNIVSAYGPEIMLWTSDYDKFSSSTIVNFYLGNGHIMNTELIYRMDETLDFLINLCSLALKQSVERESYVDDEYAKVNAFTIVLKKCSSETNPRHQMIVHNAFQYVDIADMHTIYKEMVGASGNSLVLGYLEKNFDLCIPNTCDVVHDNANLNCK